jgi:opacity protein-like surface antigen
MGPLSLLLAALLPLSSPLRAETVYLKDGGQLHGSIISAGPERIELATENGTMAIRRDRIQRIEYGTASPPAVPSQAAPPPAQPPASYSEPWREPLAGGSSLLTLGLGMQFPISDVDLGEMTGGGKGLNGDIGPLIALQYLYQLDRGVGLGAEFDYLGRSHTDSLNLLANAVGQVSGDSVLFMAVGRVLLRKEGNARPYLAGALGAHRTSTVIDAQPLLGFVWNDTGTDEPRRLVDDSAWGLASSVRVGVDFFATSPTILGLELGWTRLGSATYKATTAGQDQGLSRVKGAIDMITLAGRLGFNL